jgi:UDP-N-acetylglucosamine--N-acetylmuramyl-(pentapeptide) pyrophosphoryl-undecaprenol N-acetylglucosamine transferase
VKAARVPKLMIAGGGTGGHVLAGIAIAEVWEKQFQSKSSVCFIGSQGGMEEKLVPKAGYSLDLLHVGSLNRVSLKRKLKTFYQLPLAFIHSMQVLLREKPTAVLGVGGYSSGPVLMMARILTRLGLLKAKLAILEQNSVPGLTNRILGRFVDTVFAAFPGTERHFPRKEVVFTGNPIRSSMQFMPSAQRDPFTLFIFGGSQGAQGINTLVLDALPYLADLGSRLKWIHQTGEKDFERVQQGYFKAGVEGKIEKFIYDMPSAYCEASLLICRSGSSTLAEIAAIGRASVLIPLPTAADNHQEHNARVFCNDGAAVLFNQVKGTGEELAKMIRNVIEQPHDLETMEKKVTRFCQPLAAKAIVEKLTPPQL